MDIHLIIAQYKGYDIPQYMGGRQPGAQMMLPSIYEMQSNLPEGWPSDRMFRALALDGPCNADYLTVRVAMDSGYRLGRWPTGEHVWLHDGVPLALFPGTADFPEAREEFWTRFIENDERTEEYV